MVVYSGILAGKCRVRGDEVWLIAELLLAEYPNPTPNFQGTVCGSGGRCSAFELLEVGMRF